MTTLQVHIQAVYNWAVSTGDADLVYFFQNLFGTLDELENMKYDPNESQRFQY